MGSLMEKILGKWNRHHFPFPLQMKFGITRLVLVLISMSLVFSVQGVFADHRRPNITFIIAPADPIRHGNDASGFMFNDNGEILTRPPFGGPSGELQIVDLTGNIARVSGRDVGGDLPQLINEEGKVMYFCKAYTVCIASPPDYKEKTVISDLEELPDHVITALGGRLDRGKAHLVSIQAIDIGPGSAVYFLAYFFGTAFYDAPEIGEGCRDRVTGALNCGGTRYALVKKVAGQYPNDAVIAARSQLPFVKIVTSSSGATDDIRTGGIGRLVANDAGQVAFSFRQSENSQNNSIISFPSGSILSLPGGIINFKMNNKGDILVHSFYDGRLYVIQAGGTPNPVTPPAYIRDSRGFVVGYLFSVTPDVYDINDAGTVVFTAFDRISGEPGGLYVALPDNEGGASSYNLDRLIRFKGQFELYKDPRGIYNVSGIGPTKFLGVGPIDINNKGQVAFFSREFHDLTRGENRYSGFFVLDLGSDKKIDLSIKSINPVQVVQTTDNRIPLVKDKPTMVRVFVELKGVDELEDVPVEIEFSGIKPTNGPLTMNLVNYRGATYALNDAQFKKFQNAKEEMKDAIIKDFHFKDGVDAYNFWVTPLVIVPKSERLYTINATVDPPDGANPKGKIIEANEENNGKSTTIEVKAWKKSEYKIMFERIIPAVKDPQKHTLTVPQFAVLKADKDFKIFASKQFQAFRATFPLPVDKKFLDPQYIGGVTPRHVKLKGLAGTEIIETLGITSTWLKEKHYDRGVFVVPYSFMRGAMGLTSGLFSKTILIREDADPFTTAHEVSHTYMREAQVGEPTTFGPKATPNANALCDEYETNPGFIIGRDGDSECDSDDNPLNGLDWNEVQYPHGWVVCTELGSPDGKDRCFGWDPDRISSTLTRDWLVPLVNSKINIEPKNSKSTSNHYSLMHGSELVGEEPFHPWMAIRNYQELLKLLNEPKSDPRVLFVAGAILPNGSFELLPFSVFDSIVDEVIPGEYSFELLNSDGEILSQTSFSPIFVVNPSDPDGERISPFAFAIAYPEGVSKIRFKNNRTTLKEIIVSDNAPHITIDAIRELGGDQIRIDWNATDLDGDRISFTISYSHNGEDFLPLQLMSDEVPFNFVFDASELPGGENAVIEITATDGVNTTKVRSQPFRVPTKKPFAQILSPLFGDQFETTQEAFLSGFGYDPEDFSLVENSLEWISNIDKKIWEGERIILMEELSQGIHKLILTVTDSDGKSAHDYTVILVGEEKTLANLIKAVELLEINQGVKNSLLVKLRSAEKNVEKGKVEIARNEINAFINEVKAQRGKELRDDFADGLIEWARNLKF